MEPSGQIKLTPMMEQWQNAKNQHKDAILLFRMGDFYELFGEDAIKAAPILELALTSRDKDKAGIKMAGFPFHAADNYIEKLVEQGFKVAICEQLEDPKSSKGIVKRGITNVITPGTALVGEDLQHYEPSYLLAIRHLDQETAISALDLQSGVFQVTKSSSRADIFNEAMRLAPKEIVINSDDLTAHALAEDLAMRLKQSGPVRVEKKAKSHHEKPLSLLLTNISLSESERHAASLVLTYLEELKGAVFPHIGIPRRYDIDEQLLMDDATRFNLDLVPKRKGEKHNLFTLMNKTKTAMGRRALFHTIKAPSTSRAVIEERLDVVSMLVDAQETRSKIRELLAYIYDLEKLVALASANKISPRGLAHLRECLKAALKIQALSKDNHSPLAHWGHLVPDLSNLKDELNTALSDEPPLNLKDGGAFREGFDEELDRLANLVKNGQAMLLALEVREREQTRISSLKIKYTRVFGYYIEITKTHLDKVPAHYQRKQTIANGERYVTSELADLEARLNSAEETSLRLEEQRFQELRSRVVEHAAPIMALAKKIAWLDLVASFAETSIERSWVRPTILEASARLIDIKHGRHPLIEEICLDQGNYFVPNHVVLDNNLQSMMLITGPNMAGKSTIMRQVALIQIMAQMGCFVPAAAATLSITDAIFARVGASDDPASGRSTFMVEMTESAAILSNATADSLIVLDEIGRGTSTYDGMSIAQAVAEYIHDHLRTRTLFATHYHELTDLEAKLVRLKNFHVGVEERHDGIRFLYSLMKGPCLKSFGIQVARLSGLPKMVLDRAMHILSSLEARNAANLEAIKLPEDLSSPARALVPQLDLFGRTAFVKRKSERTSRAEN